MNRILLVDDDPVTSISLIHELEAKGFIVTSVDDGAKAIDLARALPPQQVIIDIYIPGMDGNEITSQIRDLPYCENTKFIALTDNKDQHGPQNAHRAGCDSFENKPVNFTSLIEKLTNVDLNNQIRVPDLVA